MGATAMRSRLAAIALAAFVALTLLQVSRHIFPPQDFGLRYGSGEAVREGRDPYEWPVKFQSAIERSKVNNQFLDPPPVASFFAVYSRLPYRLATYLWVALSTAAMWIAAWAALRALRVHWSPRTVAAVAIGVGLGLGPARYALINGQLDPAIAGSAVAGVYLASTKRFGWAGLLLAIALLKPQVSLLPVLAVLLVANRRRLWLSFAATAGAMCAIPLLHASSATWPNWISAVMDRPSTGIPFAWRVGLLAVAACVALQALRVLRERRDLNSTFAMAVLLQIAVAAAIYMFSYSAVLILFPVLVVVAHRWEAGPGGSRVQRIALLCLAGTLLVGGTVPATVYGGIDAAVSPFVTLVALLAAVALARGNYLDVTVAAAVNLALLLARIPNYGTTILVGLAAGALAVVVVPMLRNGDDRHTARRAMLG